MQSLHVSSRAFGLQLGEASASAGGIQPTAPDALPDDPSVERQSPASAPAPSAPLTRSEVRAEREASLHMKYIPPHWKTRKLTPPDKVLLGMQDLTSPYTVGSWFLSAGYSHLVNGQPNYGTDKGAFGQRLGAAVVRDSSEGIFTDAVYASLLHEDPRYHVEGPGHSVVHRILYAATRPLITRRDDGRPTLNGALLLGYGTASVLTNAYYPSINRNPADTVATFGTAIGGAALSTVINEFTVGLLHRDKP